MSRFKLDCFRDYRWAQTSIRELMLGYLPIVEDYSKLTEEEKQAYGALRKPSFVSEADLLRKLSLLDKEIHAPKYTKKFEEMYSQTRPDRASWWKYFSL